MHILYLYTETRLESVEVRLSHLEHRVGNIEAALTQLQSAWSYQQTNFGGPPLWPGFGISPGAGPAPGFGYQQYTPPPGFYSQPAADWSFTSDCSSITLESSQQQTASSHSVATSSHQPALLPVSSSDDRMYLPSTAIDKTCLRDVAEVVSENKRLKTKAKIATLCQIVARECFFGKKVMIRCTSGGRGSGKDTSRCLFSLPRDEMESLKKTMFSLFPEYKDCPEEFELLWDQCVTAVGNVCCRFRNNEKSTSH